MDDFSKGGVHKTDGVWMGDFQRGEYTKPMGFGWVIFSKGGVHKTDGVWMGFEMFFYCFYELSARGVYFGKYGILLMAKFETVYT